MLLVSPRFSETGILRLRRFMNPKLAKFGKHHENGANFWSPRKFLTHSNVLFRQILLRRRAGMVQLLNMSMAPPLLSLKSSKPGMPLSWNFTSKPPYYLLSWKFTFSALVSVTLLILACLSGGSWSILWARSSRVKGLMCGRLEVQTTYHFFSASVLIMYEGEPSAPQTVSVRLVDFAHVLYDKGTIDENSLNGLKAFMQRLTDIIDSVSKTPLNGITKTE